MLDTETRKSVEVKVKAFDTVPAINEEELLRLVADHSTGVDLELMGTL